MSNAGESPVERADASRDSCALASHTGRRRERPASAWRGTHLRSGAVAGHDVVGLVCVTSNPLGGVQTFRLSAEAKSGRESSAAHMEALQLRAFDAAMGISNMHAKHDGNDRHEKFLFRRFRPEMKKAVEAWLKTDPFNNPGAPLGPLKMAENAQPELEEIKRLDDIFDRAHAAAERANQNSDTYVLLTTLFATVLFFGGIAGTVNTRRLRIIILAIALVLFVVTLAFLAAMPLCTE